ncbi:hypothetical protein MTO96_015572 [Rhipicephalus appendiculatus]
MAAFRTFEERILGCPREGKTQLVAPLKTIWELRKTTFGEEWSRVKSPKKSLGLCWNTKTTYQSGAHCERCRKADRADRCAYATAIAGLSSSVAVNLSPSLVAARFPRFTTPNNEAAVIKTPAQPTR